MIWKWWQFISRHYPGIYIQRIKIMSVLVITTDVWAKNITFGLITEIWFSAHNTFLYAVFRITGPQQNTKKVFPWSTFLERKC
jgi:hypothetical protein